MKEDIETMNQLIETMTDPWSAILASVIVMYLKYLTSHDLSNRESKKNFDRAYSFFFKETECLTLCCYYLKYDKLAIQARAKAIMKENYGDLQ